MSNVEKLEEIDSGQIINVREKYLIALLAGITPVATKYLARDSDKNLADLIGIYAATSICLVILGAIVCYLSNEKNRMKLFMLALSAPALISNLSGNTYVGKERASFENPFTISAYASETNQPIVIAQAGFIDNVRRYFGANNDSGKYWVIVYSTKDRNQANTVAAAVNRVDPKYRAFVGNRRPGNPFYPVIIGNQNNESNAKKMRNHAAELVNKVPQITDRAYLDDYANRR